jgi:hypothetical protein
MERIILGIIIYILPNQDVGVAKEVSLPTRQLCRIEFVAGRFVGICVNPLQQSYTL